LTALFLFLKNLLKFFIKKCQKSVDNYSDINYTNKAVARAAGHYGVLAQLGEHLPYKQRVIGSSPIGPIYQIQYGGIAQLARAYGSYP
jgi:hypothetical protein